MSDKKITRIGVGGPVGSGKTAIIEAITPMLLEMGVRVTENDDSIRVRPQGEQRAVNVKTQVYPGFPTDLQAIFMALAASKRRGIFTKSAMRWPTGSSKCAARTPRSSLRRITA